MSSKVKPSDWQSALSSATQTLPKIGGAGGATGAVVENVNADSKLSCPTGRTLKNQTLGRWGSLEDAPAVLPQSAPPVKMALGQEPSEKLLSQVNQIGRAAPPAPVCPSENNKVRKISNAIVQEWRDRIAALHPDKDPCPGFMRDQWSEMRAIAIETLEQRGDELVALGYDANTLFGVHPTVGRARMDCVGALVCVDSDVVMVAVGVVTFANNNRWYAPLSPVPAVPIWDFVGLRKPV